MGYTPAMEVAWHGEDDRLHIIRERVQIGQSYCAIAMILGMDAANDTLQRLNGVVEAIDDDTHMEGVSPMIAEHRARVDGYRRMLDAIDQTAVREFVHAQLGSV